MNRLLMFTFALMGIGFLAQASDPSVPSVDSSQELRTKLESLPEEFVLLQIWNPLCIPCGEEVDVLNETIKTVSSNQRRLHVLATPIQARSKDIASFVDHFHPSYDQWYPKHDFKAFLALQHSVPWVLLFDKKRNLVKQWLGKLATSEILHEINSGKPSRSNN